MAEPDADALVAGQYADRTHLRPVLEAVLAALPSVGDATVMPRGTCVSLFSPRRVLATVRSTTKSRVDLGLRLTGVTSDRLLPATWTRRSSPGWPWRTGRARRPPRHRARHGGSGPEGEHTAVHVGVPTKDKRPPAVPVPGKPWWATEIIGAGRSP